NGIWGRWYEYVRTGGHGNNSGLKALMEHDPSRYPKQLRFSLLQVLPTSMVKSEVIGREELYKKKLGTRATGLNCPKLPQFRSR
ncbi:MAG: hypothetical protein ACRD30_05825, partial [Bryobacteraceae bacterium]